MRTNNSNNMKRKATKFLATVVGTTETNFNPITAMPIVELNGLRAGANATGLDLQSSNCVIRGLALNRFPGVAIYIEGSGGNTIQGNFIGTGIYGTNALPNGTNGNGGILIVSRYNVIGGVNATNRNVISGNGYAGIYLTGSGATGNTIQGNFIGPDITGTKRFTNSASGLVFDGGAGGNTVGGNVAGAGNLISANRQSGIYINSGDGNVIQGNFIGVDITGAAALSNSYDGISITAGGGSCANTLIGGTNAAARNIISGNATNGIYVTGSLNSSGTVIEGNYIGVSSNGLAKVANGLNGVIIMNSVNGTIGGTTPGAGNVISGNGYQGIYLGNDQYSYVQGIAIQNNLIGVDATGTNALGNGEVGVWLTASANVAANTIGPGNVISGNGLEGVLINSGPTANTVQGNFIGTDRTGQYSVGNTNNGVRIESPGNTIGGTNTAARNIISGNAQYGIYLYGSGTSNTLVQGNFIGVNTNGTSALPNALSGIGIVSAPKNTIGGTNTGALNLISGNTLAGISIISNTASQNTIQGNYIGTDATGTTAIGNGAAYTGWAGGGVDISSAPGTLIGGTATGTGNLISGNYWDAIAIGDGGATNTVIQGNWIGVKADGISPLGNTGHGIDIRDTGGGGNTIIGGTQTGASNILANATVINRCGVRIQSAPGNTNILVRGNSIYNNGGTGGFGIYLGSFLYAITPNESCDTSKTNTSNENLLQNYPVLAAAYSDGKNTTVTGTLNSTANSTFLLQFYNNAVITGNVQGQFFLGDLSLTTGSDCAANNVFTARFTNAVPVGQLITATATDAGNNTSEFSVGIPVLTPPPLTATASAAGGKPQLTLSWPTNNLAAATFTIVQATNLTPPVVWTALTNAPAVVGTNYSVNLASINSQRYYRLSL